MDDVAHIVGTAAESRSGTQAVDRALTLLGFIADEPLTTAQVTEKILIPRSTVLRLLSALERHGYVLRANGVWSLGPAILELASREDAFSGLARVARPYLQALVGRFHETAFLCVRERLACLCIDRVEGLRNMRFTTLVGSRTPLHAGASGRTLVAFAPRTVQDAVLSEPLKRYTSRTITDPRDLRRSLSQIRRRGYGYSDSEIDEGAFALAAPVWIGANKPLGVIVVAGPSARLDMSFQQSLSRAVLDSARQLSKELARLGRQVGGRKEER